MNGAKTMREAAIMHFLKMSVMSVFVFVACVVVSGMVSSASESDAALEEVTTHKGKPAPDFTLENLVKENIGPRDFRGSVLVLAFGFSKQTAYAPEVCRARIRAVFEGENVHFLKVVHINKPFFLTENFIRDKMKKEFEGDPVPVKYSAIDWGGAAGLDAKYGITDKEIPWYFIIDKEGTIQFACKMWSHEDNLKQLSERVSEILKAGEEAQLEEQGAAE
jgi:peroxiredoxin